MRGAARIAVVIFIGLATAWIWIRLGLYGFGWPAAAATLAPLAILTGLYLRTNRLRDLGMLVGAFAAAWASFEASAWLNAASDPAVSIPGWTPIPLATAVALFVMAAAVAIAAPSPSQ
jgi:hypothetical protein